jgi:hypothetical protein
MRQIVESALYFHQAKLLVEASHSTTNGKAATADLDFMTKILTYHKKSDACCKLACVKRLNEVLE